MGRDQLPEWPCGVRGLPLQLLGIICSKFTISVDSFWVPRLQPPNEGDISQRWTTPPQASHSIKFYLVSFCLAFGDSVMTCKVMNLSGDTADLRNTFSSVGWACLAKACLLVNPLLPSLVPNITSLHSYVSGTVLGAGDRGTRTHSSILDLTEKRYQNYVSVRGDSGKLFFFLLGTTLSGSGEK